MILTSGLDGMLVFLVKESKGDRMISMKAVRVTFTEKAYLSTLWQPVAPQAVPHLLHHKVHGPAAGGVR
jgi:hypothetical protein